MFTGTPVTHHESGTSGGMIPTFTASSLCLFQRNLAPADAGDGVSTYLALTFGTLLSSQGTDASFVLTLSGFPPGASLRSCVSDSIRSFRSDFLGAFQVPASAFPFPAVPTLSEVLSRNSRPFRASIQVHWAPGVSRSGGAVNVLERGAPMQIEAPRS